MRKLTTSFAQMLKSGLGRVRGMRRGSVLIIVVALLVMMALIGTAAITMARLDRYAARQQVTTVENEIIREAMLQRARNDAINALTRDNTGTLDSPDILNNARIDPYLSTRIPVTYTGPAAPAGFDPFVCKYPALTKATPSVSTATFAAGYKPFEDILTQNYYSDMYPDDPGASGRQMQNWVPTSIAVTYPATYPDQIMQNKTRVFPAFFGVFNLAGTGTFQTVLAGDADGDGVADCGMYRLTDTPLRGEHFYVGIKIVDNNAAINPQIAWSRDNDYDSNGNFLKNYGFFGGNVGFAEMLAKADHDYTAETKLNTPVDNLTAFNNFRFGVGTTNLGASVVPIHVPDTINNAITARTDYNYDSQIEAKDMGLDRRLKSPTYNRDSDGNGTAEFYQSLPLGDSTAFAYKNNFVNPTGSQGQLGGYLPYSLLYSAPNYTIDPAKRWRYYPANPMDPTNAYNVWWNQMDYSSGSLTMEGKPRTIRQLIETLNPTIDVGRTKQNAIFDWNGDGAADAKDPPYPGMLPWTLTNAGTWASGGNYRIDNIVKDNDPSAPFFSYIATWADPATGNNTGNEPFTGANITASPVFWEYQPYVTGNAPTSVNTATFREIFRSFYSVMVEGNGNVNIPQALWNPSTTDSWGYWVSQNEGSTPPDLFNPTLALDAYNPFLGREFDPIGTPPNYYAPKRPTGQLAPAPYEENRLRMFGNVIRDVRGGKQNDGTAGTALFNSSTNKSLRMNPSQVMVLRSALAAINLIGMRDQGILAPGGGGTVILNNVYSRTITLYDTPTATAAAAPSPAPFPRFQATVFSTARQPYITEVLAYNMRDPANGYPNGYVAIELHNPYPVPLDIGGWEIATVDRRNPRSGTLTPPSSRYPATVVTGTGVLPASNPPPNDFSNMVLRPLTTGAAGVLGIPRGDPNAIIPANGYLILENYDPTGAAADTTKATARPPLAGAKLTTLPAQTKDLYIANLHEVMEDPATNGSTNITGSEFVLLRPRRGDGVPTASIDWYGAGHVPPYDTFDEGNLTTHNLQHWVPIDSFDFSGFELVGAAGNMSRLHYIRASHGGGDSLIVPAIPATDTAQWRCVYPGRYNGNENIARNQGTEIATVTALDATEPAPIRDITLGYGDVFSSFEYRPLLDPPSTDPLFPAAQNFTIPLCEIDWPGYNTLYNVTTGVMEAQPYKWPYGGFTRVGDLMKVPYMGAYVLREVEQSAAGTYPAGMADPGTLLANRFPAVNHPAPLATPILADEYLLEVNPVTMDSVFAEDSAAAQNNNINEDVGRFCPSGLYQGWAIDLFNYFTVTHNFADDYMPNMNPVQYWRLTGVYPQRIGNDSPTPETANEGGEDAVAAHGLININTAPAEVLDMVPMVLDSTAGPTLGKVKEPENRQLADAIVAYRSDPTKGPFQSLFDLNKVAVGGNSFQNAWGQINFASGPGAGDPDDFQGDFSPYNLPLSARTGMPTTDGVRNDFEERYLQVARLSNLLTVRSDSFNVYVLVQSWKNIGAGTLTPPMLTWEKRIAFTADRSSVDPATQGRILKITDIPAD